MKKLFGSFVCFGCVGGEDAKSRLGHIQYLDACAAVLSLAAERSIPSNTKFAARGGRLGAGGLTEAKSCSSYMLKTNQLNVGLDTTSYEIASMLKMVAEEVKEFPDAEHLFITDQV